MPPLPPSLDEVTAHLQRHWPDLRPVVKQQQFSVGVLGPYPDRDRYLTTIENGLLRELGFELILLGLTAVSTPTLTWSLITSPEQDGLATAEDFDPRSPSLPTFHPTRSHVVVKADAWCLVPFAPGAPPAG